jgi:Ca-activated chloride channel homolog
MMTFLLKPMLLALVLVPVCVAAYIALVKRQRRRASQLAAQGFAPTATALRQRKLRHIPFVFFLAGITLLLGALARPHTSVSMPRREGTVILAFDVSNSMKATDLEPTRMEAAKVAATAFVQKQPKTIKVGVVAFGNGGVITQPPTDDKPKVLAAIKRLQPQGATSLGQGIFSSLTAISGKPLEIDPEQIAAGPEEIDIGYFGSSAVVLLSDGENTSELDPVEMAKLASVAGVKIYTIGVGSPEGTVVDIDGFKVGTALDADLLGEISTISDGKYFAASDEQSLAAVYQSIDLQWKTAKELTEVTGLITGASTLLLAVGAGLSLLWFGRLV